MIRLARNLAFALACASLTACVGLEYPNYWSPTDGFLVNLITLPFEVLFTPVIFILKLFPVL